VENALRNVNNWCRFRGVGRRHRLHLSVLRSALQCYQMNGFPTAYLNNRTLACYSAELTWLSDTRQCMQKLVHVVVKWLVSTPPSLELILLWHPFCRLQFMHLFSPLKPSIIMCLHCECSVPYKPNLPFLISDIRTLWCSGLSARVSECQKVKM